jgi:hypothetical protein
MDRVKVDAMGDVQHRSRTTGVRVNKCASNPAESASLILQSAPLKMRISNSTEKHNYCRNFSRIGVALIAMGYIAPYH